ncbi:MAG: arylsulfatase [Burkholderiaceae bacterium]|nr:arylsulfatase [Burkholderiaceae bacterium]
MNHRIALIHALAHSVAPINEALQRQWPDASRMNLLDDSLSADLARSATGLDAAMTGRFLALADYAVGTGAHALLFTCSAFGPCIEAVAQRYPDLPVLKPNEATIRDAVRARKPVGLVASFAPTLQSMPAEFPAGVLMGFEMAEGAMEALNAGDLAAHDAAVAAAAFRLKNRGAAVVALAQFSMARAGDEVARLTGLPVLTTPGSAIVELRRRLGGT